MKVKYDNLIYKLQKQGGVTTYWKQLTSLVKNKLSGKISYVPDYLNIRMFPVLGNNTIFHSSYFRPSFGLNVKKVVTVHDMAYEYGLAGDGVGKFVNNLERSIAYKQASGIIFVSEFTKLQFLEMFPSYANHVEMAVIHHGAPLILSNSKYAFTPDYQYILFVGKRSGYKNFENALLGFYHSKLYLDNVRLLCIGGGSFYPAEQQLIDRLKIGSYVMQVGGIDDAQLQAMYRNAYCLLYISKYEGFGIPCIEAGMLGCPVVSSRAASIPEVVGNAGIYVDENDEQDIARGLLQLSEQNVRQELITLGSANAQRFTWDKCANQHIDFYNILS